MNLPLDPELAPWFTMFPVIDHEDAAHARALADRLIADAPRYEPSVTLRAEDRSIPGLRPSDPPVRVVVYRAADGDAVRPAVLNIHGGAFILGTPEISFRESAMCAEAGAVVVSVDYRLAPENPYPAGLDDCSAALTWMVANASELGVDPGRIAVVGASAGGGLAAGLALRVRDEKGPALCLQVLAIPELDDRLATTSMRVFRDIPGWNGANAVWSWRHYLGPDLVPGSDAVPIYAAPGRATDLAGLPPAFVSVCEFDPLRDEDLDYGRRLVEAGVPTEMHLYPGTFHGATLIPAAGVSQRMVRDEMSAITRALGLPEFAPSFEH